MVRSLLVDMRGHGPWLQLQEAYHDVSGQYLSSPMRLKSVTQCMSQYNDQRKDVNVTTHKLDLALHTPTGSKS